MHQDGDMTEGVAQAVAGAPSVQQPDNAQSRQRFSQVEHERGGLGQGADATFLRASSASYVKPQLPPLNINQDPAFTTHNGSQPTPRISYAPSYFTEHEGYIADVTSPAGYSIAPDRRSYRRDSGHGFIPTVPLARPYSIKDGYTPGNPFNQSLHTLTEVSSIQQGPVSAPTTNGTQTLPGPQPATTEKKKAGFWSKTTAVLWQGYSVQAFNGVLLFLPLLYFSRVTAIFAEVHCSGERLRAAIKKNIREQLEKEKDAKTPGSSAVYWDTSACPQEVQNLDKLWNNFITTLTKEWETMNLVAVLLLSAIISSMQIGPVFNDEIVRYIAFAALVCGLMSLMFSCTYIIRFSVMRPIHKAVEWAKEGEAEKIQPFWNVWILLSVPAIWLSWALILFVAEIIAFMWLIDSSDSAKTLAPRLRLAARVAISVILASGIVYLILILHTLRRYGAQMDHAWKQSIDEEFHTEHADLGPLKIPEGAAHHQHHETITVAIPRPPFHHPFTQEILSPRPLSSVSHSTHRTTGYFDIPFTHTPVNEAPSEPISEPVHRDDNATEFYRPVKAIKFSFHGGRVEQVPEPPKVVYRRLGDQRVWHAFVEEIIQTWRSAPLNVAWESVLGVLRRWNLEQLRPRHMEAFLAYETGPPPSQVQHYLVYVTDQSFATSLSRHFPNVPDGVEHSQIFDDTGALKLTLAPPGKAEQSDRIRRSRPEPERQRSKTLSSEGTLDISIYPPSTPGSRASTVDSDYVSAADASDAVSNTPTEVEVEVEPEPAPVPEVPREVEEPPTPVARPEILRRPRSAMRTPSSRSLESKRVRHADEIPALPPPPIMTQIPEASRTTEELATRQPSPTGPGVSPLLRRHLSYRFLYDHTSEIQDTYSTDELSASATLIPTPTLVIWHKQIPYTLYVKKDPSITINDLLDELGKQLHKPVPKNYLRGSESDVVSRLRTAAGQRARAGGKRGQDPPVDVICTADWIWSKKIRIAGFVEHPNGTWELETEEN